MYVHNIQRRKNTFKILYTQTFSKIFSKNDIQNLFVI